MKEMSSDIDDDGDYSSIDSRDPKMDPASASGKSPVQMSSSGVVTGDLQTTTTASEDSPTNSNNLPAYVNVTNPEMKSDGAAATTPERRREKARYGRDLHDL